MICEMYNKMLDIDDHIFYFDGNGSIITNHHTEVSLSTFVGELVLFILACVFLYWWLWPTIYIYHKYFMWTEKITFKCKRKD